MNSLKTNKNNLILIIKSMNEQFCSDLLKAGEVYLQIGMLFI